MKPNRKRHLVVAGVAALSLVGAGAAVAATVGGPFSPARHACSQAGMNRGGTNQGLMAGGVVMDAAAEYIGVSEDTLRTERHDGKSLAQIAVAHGKTAAGLEQALVAAFKADTSTAVASGRITSEQAAQAVATFQSRVHTMIERTATGPMGGHGAGMGLGRGGGPGLGLGFGGGGR